MAKRIAYAIMMIAGVVIAFPYIKQFADVFNASGGVFEQLPGMVAWETFFWGAFPYMILFGVPVVAIIIILRRRGGG